MELSSLNAVHLEVEKKRSFEGQYSVIYLDENAMKAPYVEIIKSDETGGDFVLKYDWGDGRISRENLTNPESFFRGFAGSGQRVNEVSEVEVEDDKILVRRTQRATLKFFGIPIWFSRSAHETENIFFQHSVGKILERRAYSFGMFSKRKHYSTCRYLLGRINE